MGGWADGQCCHPSWLCRDDNDVQQDWTPTKVYVSTTNPRSLLSLYLQRSFFLQLRATASVSPQTVTRTIKEKQVPFSHSPIDYFCVPHRALHKQGFFSSWKLQGTTTSVVTRGALRCLCVT